MKKEICFMVFVAGLTVPVHADEARLLRFPSTNGTDVVFTYAGDLYRAPLSGGEAQRLTSHVGYEIFPHYSPDGKSIAFTGQYDGNTEVYLIPSDGGEPQRLTYTSTNSRDDLGDRMGPNNIVMTWSRDGKEIVYRNRIGDGFEGKLWRIGKEGGMSEALPLPEGGFCSYSPDGKKLAYNRVFREFRSWKYYRGGMADDIWIYDTEAKKVTNVTNNVAQDIFPMWIGDEIFFASDRDMTMNLFVYNTKTGQTEKVTNYTDYDVKFPSSDGNTIVYEHGGYLYRLDPKTRQSEQIHITLNGENVYARTEQKHVANNLTAVSLSPNGKRLAVTARGEVFDVPVAKGVTRNITRTPGAHERDAEWSYDGKNIAYISDRTGETEIWLEPAEGGEPVQLTKDNDTYIRQLAWSPDNKTILYTDRKNRIVVVDVASKTKKVLMQNSEAEFRDVAFSADSQWITYTKPASNDLSVVYIYNLTSGKEYPVTEKWYNSSEPTFSSDGKYLIFSSDRDFNPIYGRLEWNHVYTRMGGIYLVPLALSTPSPFLGEDASGADSKDNTTTAASDKKKDDKKESTGMKVDTDNMYARIIKLPLDADNYYNFYSDGKAIWYQSKGDVHAFNLDTQKDEVVAENARLAGNPTSDKSIIYLQKNKWYVSKLSTGKVALKDPVNLSDMVATIDYNQEWAQIFDEAWRAYRDGFYLENMHGKDWKVLKAKYAQLLPYVKTRLDLNYVIGELIGELGVGHAYVNPGEMPRGKRVSMGLLGAEISRDKSGFFRLEKILPGASWSEKLRSPLEEPGIEAKAGDYIVAIDGVATNSVNDLYKLLVGKAGVATEIALNSRPSLDGARKVVIRPLAEEYSLYHYNWVQENIRKVEKATNGRVGYVYIPDMGPDGLNEFSRYFYPQLDKEGLIVDDRANGGGNVSPMILERLAREPYRLTMRRGSSLINTVPDATLVGPKVCLINKYSASDGDLFPWGFRALGLGKLIGTRTWGGIIGISGSLPYMDGTDIRVPFFTSYDPKTGDWIIENHGVDPDILIDNDPIREWNGEDQQLDRAIQEVMNQLKDRKPLAPVPAPRDWSK